jgi:hypothetical protein
MKELSCSRTVPNCMWPDQLNAMLWEVLKHPTCSMDLSSCNFHIFGPFKKDPMTICRRLWYSGIGGCPRNFFANGCANLCTSCTPASVPMVIFFSLWVHLNGFHFIICTSYVAYCCAQFRLVVIGLGGLLTRVCYILQCLPLYVSILWMLQSTVISSKYQVEDIFRLSWFTDDTNIIRSTTVDLVFFHTSKYAPKNVGPILDKTNINTVSNK